MAEPRYGGAFVPQEVEAVDPKSAVDEKCGLGCVAVWEKYEACASRIEEKGRGECSGFYMDYFQCVDKCSSKNLFKHLA